MNESKHNRKTMDKTQEYVLQKDGSRQHGETIKDNRLKQGQWKDNERELRHRKGDAIQWKKIRDNGKQRKDEGQEQRQKKEKQKKIEKRWKKIERQMKGIEDNEKKMNDSKQQKEKIQEYIPQKYGQRQ